MQYFNGSKTIPVGTLEASTGAGTGWPGAISGKGRVRGNGVTVTCKAAALALIHNEAANSRGGGSRDWGLGGYRWCNIGCRYDSLHFRCSSGGLSLHRASLCWGCHVGEGGHASVDGVIQPEPRNKDL